MNENDVAGKARVISHQVAVTRAFVIVPVLSQSKQRQDDDGVVRSVASRIEEATGLAQAIALDVVRQESVTVNVPKPATLLGPGKVNDIAAQLKADEIDLVVVDHALSPVQQRNLEKTWQCKVIDRTALILEIFGDRARTKEGVLQVELAHLNYQKGRLVRSWTHLERQRGGGGFLGGPGETQIEADRRQLQEKIVRIQNELAKVVKTRKLHRSKRKKTPHPVIALVGYTNAGKSTLFNRLTGANVMAKDMLFATLDPTLRRIELPHGDIIILSDTVGFISNLPTHLIAAFRATLEEVVESDLIIHVRDMSDSDNAAHAQDVLKILKSLNVDVDDPQHIIEAWNKIDLLEKEVKKANTDAANSSAVPSFPLSAETGEGVDVLLKEVETLISGAVKHVSFVLKPEELSFLDWIYQYGKNIQRHNFENGDVKINVDFTAATKAMFDWKIKNGNFIKSE